MRILDNDIYRDATEAELLKRQQEEQAAPDALPTLEERVEQLAGEIAATKAVLGAEWKQPDSTNPYMKGIRVLFNGKVYESTIDNNVWSPEDYPAGWKEVHV